MSIYLKLARRRLTVGFCRRCADESAFIMLSSCVCSSFTSLPPLLLTAPCGGVLIMSALFTRGDFAFASDDLNHTNSDIIIIIGHFPVCEQRQTIQSPNGSKNKKTFRWKYIFATVAWVSRRINRL